MVLLKSLFFLATAALVAAKALQIRSFGADVVLLDLGILEISVKGLNAAIDFYPGGTAEGASILGAFSAVHAANSKTFHTCQSIKNLTSWDSYQIIDYFSATLAKDIPASIKALETKKEHIVKANLQELIVSSLDLMKYDHESLSQVLAKKESQEQDVQLKMYVVVKEIDDAIKDGIAYFSSISDGSGGWW